MARRNIKKLIIVLACIIFVFMLISCMMTIKKCNHVHLAKQESCVMCMVINDTENIFKNLSILFFMVLLPYLIAEAIAKAPKSIQFISNTPIDFKVQMNE